MSSVEIQRILGLTVSAPDVWQKSKTITTEQNAARRRVGWFIIVR